MPCGRHPVSLPPLFLDLDPGPRELGLEKLHRLRPVYPFRWCQEPAWLEVHSERVVRVGWRVGSQRVLKSTAISPQFLAVGPRIHACSLCYL